MWHISFDPICTIAASKCPHDTICSHSSLCSLAKVGPPQAHQITSTSSLFTNRFSAYGNLQLSSPFKYACNLLGNELPITAMWWRSILTTRRRQRQSVWLTVRFTKLFVCDQDARPLSTRVQWKWPGSIFKCLNWPPVTSVIRLRTTSLVTHVSTRVNFCGLMGDTPHQQPVFINSILIFDQIWVFVSRHLWSR